MTKILSSYLGCAERKLVSLNEKVDGTKKYGAIEYEKSSGRGMPIAKKSFEVAKMQVDSAFCNIGRFRGDTFEARPSLANPQGEIRILIRPAGGVIDMGGLF
jgi:hypothetical protein